MHNSSNTIHTICVMDYTHFIIAIHANCAIKIMYPTCVFPIIIYLIAVVYIMSNRR